MTDPVQTVEITTVAVGRLPGTDLNVAVLMPDEGHVRHLNIRVTHEGVIFDAYLDDVLVETLGMTFDEWFDHVTDAPVDARSLGAPDVWAHHPGHPRADWQYEVRNGDTNLGYWDWCEHRAEVLNETIPEGPPSENESGIGQSGTDVSQW